MGTIAQSPPVVNSSARKVQRLVLDLHINTSTMSIIINTIAPTITEACIHENYEIIESVTEAVVGDSTLNTNDGTVEETAD